MFATGALLFAQNDTRPVAVVRLMGTETITVSQFKTVVENNQRALGQVLTKDQQRQLLDSMIDEKLLLQGAIRDRVVLSDAELNQQVQELRNQMASQVGRQPTEDEFASAIRSQTGLELAVFREQLRQQLLMQKYVLTKKDALLKTIQQPTEQDIINAYNINKSQFIRPDTVRFSMIEVPFSTAAQKTQAKTVADRLVREIASNASKFDEAVIKGQTVGAGYNAGDAGYIPRTPQAQQLFGLDLMNTAFSLRQGEVSKLIEGNTGFYIIKITETYAMKALTLDDIAQLGSRVTVRQYISSGILQERQQALLNRAVQELTVELRAGNPFQVYDSNLTW
ncbi:membrane protein [Spirochaetia bacterium]|nr:membrane protein [Spirochaetia bacterium]GHU36305.1 membrane protein [Spirochaetia bacterium]